MAVEVIQVVNGSLVSGTAASVTSTLTNAIVAGDVVAALIANNGANGNHTVAGLGATWTRVGKDSLGLLDLWVGTGATATGTVTATQTVASAGGFKYLNLWHVRGTTSAYVGGADNAAANTLVGTGMSAGPGQIFIGSGYAETSGSTFLDPNPATGWVNTGDLIMDTTRQASRVYRIPGTTGSHYFSTFRSGTAHPIVRVVIGSAPAAPVAAAVSAEVTVTTALSAHRTQATPVGAGVTVSTALSPHHVISVPADVEATVTTVLNSGGSTAVPVDVAVTVSTTLTEHHALAAPIDAGLTITTGLSAHHSLTVPVGVAATVTTVLVDDAPEARTAPVGVNVTVLTKLTTNPRITVPISVEAVTFTELFYEFPPAELGTSPLGKLVNYTVGTSAVPLNPAEGSGSTPTVGGTYLKGLDPELALGELNVLKAGNIGTYEGEIVNLSMDKASASLRVSMSTPLTLLNTEMALFPFVDAAESTWTAVRAIDYWTQQCGLFYDKVPGDVISYASAYGHNNSYAAGNTSRFYERLTGGTTATTVVNERSVKTFGFNVTSTTAFHEDDTASVPITMLNRQKLLFSIGMGIRGTGRTATVSWKFLDAQDRIHTLAISATSAGLITATVDGVVVDSTNVAGDADYRITASLETLGSVQIGKLTVHTDDLAGNGTQVFSGTARVLPLNLPSALRVKSITHVSSGGSGSLMLRWGTYLSVDKKHPLGVPAIQKSLAESKKPRLFVSGFEGNVWSRLNEFCSIARLDVRFLGESLSVGPRNTALTAPDGNFSQFTYSSERRDKYKQVAVVNQNSRADTTDTALLWRADSVYQVAAREVFETTVQTEHSILNVVNPVAVWGIEPYPYRSGGGQYVVTGADGYIISPQWWNDNGGKVEASLTGKFGEIAIKITAPTVDTVRAPYRISEGEADRPALYISGSGILNKPKEVHVGTGAKNAKEGFDTVFESPFMSNVVETYDAAMAMASEYSAHNAEVDFEIPNDFDKPSRFGQFPAGLIFTDNVRNYRIDKVTQTNSKVSGTAVTHTTIGAYVASFPEGATIADAKARHFGKNIRQFNITPLRGTSG